MATFDPQKYCIQQPPTEADWEYHRAIIKQLYWVENQTLKDVQYILADNFGFRGSTPLFKKHITKWGLDKKRKRGEMIFAYRVMKKRRSQGKATRITIRGREFTRLHINKYFKRAPLLNSGADSDVDMTDVPPGLTVSTPSPQPLPLGDSPTDESISKTPTNSNNSNCQAASLRTVRSRDLTPTNLQNPDIMSGAHRASRRMTSLHCHRPSPFSISENLVCLDISQQSLVLLNKFLNEVSVPDLHGKRSTTALKHALNAGNLRRVGDGNQSWQEVNSLMVSLKPICKNATPLSLFQIFEVYDICDTTGIDVLPAMLMEHVYGLAEIYHTSGHPFTILISKLRQTPIADLLENATYQLANQFAKTHGTTSRLSISSTVAYACYCRSKSSKAAALSRLTLLRGSDFRNPSVCSNFYETLVMLEMETGNLAGAESVLEEWGSNLKRLSYVRPVSVKWHFRLLFAGAALMRQQGFEEEARYKLRQAWDASVASSEDHDLLPVWAHFVSYGLEDVIYPTSPGQIIA